VDGLVIWESNTILRYLATKANNRFYSGDAAVRSEIERWMDWLLAALNPTYGYMFWESKKPPEERAVEFAAKETEMAVLLSILDGVLTGKSWIAGEDITIADIALGPIVKRCAAFPIALPALHALKSWLGRLDARPAFRSATTD
jgi:glutathione S-transferase